MRSVASRRGSGWRATPDAGLVAEQRRLVQPAAPGRRLSCSLASGSACEAPCARSSAPRHGRFEDLLVALCDLARVVARFDAFRSIDGHSGRERAKDGVGHGRRVADRYEPPVAAVVEDLARAAAAVGGADTRTAPECFGDRQGPSFPYGREHEEVSRSHVPHVLSTCPRKWTDVDRSSETLSSSSSRRRGPSPRGRSWAAGSSSRTTAKARKRVAWSFGTASLAAVTSNERPSAATVPQPGWVIRGEKDA